MKSYTVKQLAELANVSVRTLQYYDRTGLLKPALRTKSNYRLYRREELDRLQQILFFKELDFPLKQIGRILDDPGFDRIAALESHRKLLQTKAERIERLKETIDKTITQLSEETMNRLTDEELYEGFSKEQIERYKYEVREKYDPKLVAESENRMGKMTRAEWLEVTAEGDRVTHMIAKVMDRDVSDHSVQELIARHHTWIGNFYTATAEIYAGLGEMYAENPEFREFYDNYRSGLADFMKEAMIYYAEHTLK